MNDIATTTRTKIESLLPVQVLLPAMLGMNTLALIAFDRLGAFPDWIKTAAALFLAF